MTGAGKASLPMAMPMVSFFPFAANARPGGLAPSRSRHRIALLEGAQTPSEGRIDAQILGVVIPDCRLSAGLLCRLHEKRATLPVHHPAGYDAAEALRQAARRSEEHTSELQSLMRI